MFDCVWGWCVLEGRALGGGGGGERARGGVAQWGVVVGYVGGRIKLSLSNEPS